MNVNVKSALEKQKGLNSNSCCDGLEKTVIANTNAIDNILDIIKSCDNSDIIIKIEYLEKEIKELKSDIKDLKDDVKDLEECCEENYDAICDINKDIKDLKDDVKDLEECCEENYDAICDINKDIKDLKDDVKDLEECCEDSYYEVIIPTQTISFEIPSQILCTGGLCEML